MSLPRKRRLGFDITVAVIFTVAVTVGINYATRAYILDRAGRNVQNLILSHRGLHQYIQEIMHPTFYNAVKKGSISDRYYAPQIFSSSYIVRVMHGFYNKELLKYGRQEIYYKLASENPRNPVNKADVFESNLIKMFNNRRDLKDYREIITLDGKKYLYYAIPFLENTQACLHCHGKREDAPLGLQALYPGEGGFNEKVGHIRAIESIRAPLRNDLGLISTVLAVVGATALSLIGLFLFGKRLQAEVHLKTSQLEDELVIRKETENDLRIQAAILEEEIAQRQKTEEALLHEKKYAENLLQGANIIIVGLDNTGRVTIMNNTAEEITGYSRYELVGKNWFETMVPREAFSNDYEVFENIKQGHRLESVENEILTKDGQKRIISWRNNPISEDGVISGTLSFGIDITEHRKLEEQLIQSQKLEVIGQLAGGVAHDFNNILQVIMGYGTLLEMDKKLDEHQQNKVEQILTSAEKASHLTSGLLAFSRKQSIAPKLANLHHIILNVQKFIARIIGEDIQIKTILNESNLPVKVDSGQIEQVLINLATNARDAMPKGGTLNIETSVQVIDAKFKRLHGYGEPGRYACMAVSDTGKGMDEKTRKKIFEPFFTTKEVGKGTGLGMAIVYGIVKQHNGYINVYSEQGHGSTVRVCLPLAGTEESKHEEEELQISPKMGTETILLAEDEPAVRTLIESILKKYGYEIILAEDGAEAVEKFSANRDRVNLILMDMIMPKKNGKEAYLEICRIKPGVKVIYTSGYTADFIQDRGISEDGIELITKPVYPMELLIKVREVLEK